MTLNTVGRPSRLAYRRHSGLAKEWHQLIPSHFYHLSKPVMFQYTNRRTPACINAITHTDKNRFWKGFKIGQVADVLWSVKLVQRWLNSSLTARMFTYMLSLLFIYFHV